MESNYTKQTTSPTPFLAKQQLDCGSNPRHTFGVTSSSGSVFLTQSSSLAATAELSCCVIAADTEIRDRRARNRVTRADAAADCFCLGIGSKGRQTHGAGGGRQTGGRLRGAAGRQRRRERKQRRAGASLSGRMLQLGIRHP